MRVRGAGEVSAEAKVLLKLSKHPRLLQYIGMCVQGDDQLLITEFASRGSLKTALEDIEDDMTPAHQLSMLQQVCAGMEALAAEGIVHRDLAYGTPECAPLRL